jgi:hypothetical protein
VLILSVLNLSFPFKYGNKPLEKQEIECLIFLKTRGMLKQKQKGKNG